MKDFKAYLDEYLVYLGATGCAKTTIHNHRSYLNDFFNWLEAQKIIDLKAITNRQIEEYRLYLKTRLHRRKNTPLAADSQYNNMNAIEGFFKWLEKTNQILITPVSKQFAPRKSKADKLPDIIPEEEIIKILDSCPTGTLTGLRDRTILELLYSTGIRRNELVNLNVSNYSPEKQELFIAKGKGGKDRIVPVGDVAASFLEAYLKLVRPWLVKSPEETAIFLNVDRGIRLKTYSIGDIVKKAVEKSGLDVKITPHIFRHSMATHLLRNGADLRHIQALLGHASIETTEIYTHLTVEDLKQAVKKAHPHGKRAAKENG